MLKKFLSIPFCIIALALSGCLGSDDDSPATTADTIPEITVTCTTATDAVCDTASNGEIMYMIWTDETCLAFTGNSIQAYNNQLATCAGGSCTANTTSNNWLDNETDAATTSIPASATTAGAWLNFVDNGVNDDDGPDTGDIFCCAENQTGDAAITDGDCTVI